MERIVAQSRRDRSVSGTVSNKRSAGNRAKGARTRGKASENAKPAKGAAKKRVKTPRRAARKSAPKGVRYVPGPLIDGEPALQQAMASLLAQDREIVGALMEIGGHPPLRRREPGFAGLAAIIVSQQVSVASASAIFGRLEKRLAPLEAASLLAAEDAVLRECGLSSPKMKALRALARAVAEQGLDLGALGAMDAHDAHRALVEVSGIGPWTADIFLLFCLGHPDAFPAGDLALQEAAKLALGLKTRPDAQKLEKIAERWRPWRGVAARMLWSYYRGVKRRSGMALANATG
jgi:DNA-3-methyladenine glycosylase II